MSTCSSDYSIQSTESSSSVASSVASSHEYIVSSSEARSVAPQLSIGDSYVQATSAAAPHSLQTPEDLMVEPEDDFRAALDYLQQVGRHFRGNAHGYEMFMKIWRNFETGKGSIFETNRSLEQLFYGHANLLEQFNYWIVSKRAYR